MTEGSNFDSLSGISLNSDFIQCMAVEVSLAIGVSSISDTLSDRAS